MGTVVLKKYLQNENGFSLIKQLFRKGLLFYAIYNFLLLPKNRKGLELLREILNTKFYQKLKRKYLRKVSRQDYNLTLKKPKIIWFCWLQGLDNAPELVKKCFTKLREILSDYDIKILTKENIFEYTDLPEYIIEKWNKGIITNTHFSDILRNNLLVKNGGTWIDSTVLLTDKLPEDIEVANLFLFQTLKPGCDGKAVSISSWFISSIPHNPVLEVSQKLLYYYWEKNDYLCDYFLFHDFVQIGLDLYPEIYDEIPKYTNETPHIMLFNLSKKYDKRKFNNICKQSFIHKLTYKLSEDQKKDKTNLYNELIK